LSSRKLGGFSGFSDVSKSVLLSAFSNAYKQRRDAITSLEIFFEAYKQDLFIQELMQEQGIDENQFTNMVEWLRINEKMVEQYHAFKKAALFK